MSRLDPRLRQLIAQCREARALSERDEIAEARELLNEVRSRADALGIRTPYVLWLQAEVALKMGKTEDAAQFIFDAVKIDPLNPVTQASFNQVCGKLRSELADPERDALDPKTQRSYELLSWAGETDVSCHVAYARYLRAEGRPDEAMRLVEAVTLLAPASLHAWRLKAELAREKGDVTLAERCEREVEDREPAATRAESPMLS